MTNSISSISIMLRCSTKVTGLPTKDQDPTITTAQLLNQITGKVLNNALNHGNAEEQECAREEDGALDSMDAKDPHSQHKPQVSSQLTEIEPENINFVLFKYTREIKFILRDFFTYIPKSSFLFHFKTINNLSQKFLSLI